jgi:hypothetical protein
MSKSKAATKRPKPSGILTKEEQRTGLTQEFFRRIRQENAREINGHPLDIQNVSFIARISKWLVTDARVREEIKR